MQGSGFRDWRSGWVCLQVAITLAAVAGVTMALAGASGPMAVVLGGGLALSSTAVAMQVCCVAH